MLTNSFAASRANNIVIAPVFQGNTLEFEKGGSGAKGVASEVSHMQKFADYVRNIYG